MARAKTRAELEQEYFDAQMALDRQLNQKDAAIAQKDAELQQKEAEIARLRALLKQSDR